MIRYRAPRRGGFTLIELLVVISILALLAALVAAGIGKVRSSQQTRNTEATLTKLQQALSSQRTAVIDQCKQDKLNGKIPQAILTFCGNDKDAAEAVWVYAKLKQEFPETFVEASGDVCPNSAQRAGDTRLGIWLWFNAANPTVAPTNSDAAVLILQPRATFAKYAKLAPPGGGGGGPNESAALLYAILTDSAKKGVVFSADDATAGAQTEIPFTQGANKDSFRVFTDTWGTPIWFNRLANFTELQGQPFVSAALAGSANRDPIDPLGKLFGFSTAQKNSIHLMAAPPTITSPPGLIDGSNKMITVYSAGPDKTPQVTSGNTSSDDVIGYRLRRQGASGG